MTDKQRSCIKWICETLGLKYYGQDTKSDASRFISKYIDRAKDVGFYNSWGLSFLLNRPF